MPDLLDQIKSALADRYAIERELGASRMATVYSAKDLQRHRTHSHLLRLRLLPSIRRGGER